MFDFKLSKKAEAQLLDYEKLRTEAVNADAMDAMSTRIKNLNVQHQRHEDWKESIATLIEIENAQTHELVRIANALERAFPKPEPEKFRAESEGGRSE